VIEDFLSINFETHSSKLQPGDELFISLGFNAEFADCNNAIWLPDQEYTKGTYGHEKGLAYMANKDLIVTNAKDRPVLYNYSLEGADTYKLDVPDGNYLVELHFAETKYFHPEERVFDVLINDVVVFKNLDMVKTFGFLKAFNKTIQLEAKNSKGIQIKLDAIKGKTSISALQIKRLN